MKHKKEKRILTTFTFKKNFALPRKFAFTQQIHILIYFLVEKKVDTLTLRVDFGLLLIFYVNGEVKILHMIFRHDMQTFLHQIHKSAIRMSSSAGLIIPQIV